MQCFFPSGRVLFAAAVVFGWVAAARAGTPAAPVRDGDTHFVRRVLPVLRARCFACHGGDPKQVVAGLNLTDRVGLLRGGKRFGAGVLPDHPESSPVYLAVRRADPRVPPMPPKESDRLSVEDLTSIREWIAAGAPWPARERVTALEAAAHPPGVTVSTSGGLTADWTRRTYRPEDLWAYRPLRRPPVPPGAASPVDAFVNRRLAQQKLRPGPPAARRVLIRRVTFDLTGLPPTPEEVERFVRDPAPDTAAFVRVVDRLLASPQYGEQMAQHWLDLVRYADSSGFANDYDRGNAWRYRDYVVRSFNADKSYARFIQEQLAGDELDPDDPEMWVATGFLRMGAWELTGMEVPKIARQRFLDDVTDTVGQVFLGQMLQCARCHDHKYDPVPTRDYYRIQAVFATTQVAERPTPFLASESRACFEERKYLDARRAPLEAELRRIEAAQQEARRRWEAQHPEQVGQRPPWHNLLPVADLGRERVARKGLERLKWEYERYEPVALSVFTGPTPDVRGIYAPFRVPSPPITGALETTHILAGGDPFSPAAPVTPGVLSAAGDRALPTTACGRRRAFADWVTDPANPLPARVMANRLWQWTFGIPLAGNPNNFGATGKKPALPELLDWLASALVSPQPGAGATRTIKGMMRLLVMSDAYRRSSQHPAQQHVRRTDPDGSSYAAFPARRLTAEELRDALLAVSGELNTAVGGIPVRPEMHPAVALQPRQVMGTFAPAWEPSPLPAQRHRRTLYALKLRGLPDPFLEVFNAPAADRPCERRETSTVAPQALTLLHGRFGRARALALAHRLQRNSASREDTISRLFQQTLGRRPTPQERRDCLRHWSAMTLRHRRPPARDPLPPREIVREAVEENTGEKFTFTEPLVVAPDFKPDLHPADVTPEVRGLAEVCHVLLNTNEFLYLD